MDIFAILLVVGLILGLILFLVFFLDGLIMVEPLEKLEYIAQMGIILAPCVVMSTDQFGEPYTLQTWILTLGIMLGCLLLTMFLRIFIESIEEYADRRQIKKQKKTTKKAANKLLGRKTVKKFKTESSIEKVEDTNIYTKAKEKRKIRVIFGMQLARAKGSTLAAATLAPFIIALNAGLDKLFDPICILTVLLGVGISLLCGWCSNKLLSEI